jgi:putative transport protein
VEKFAHTLGHRTKALQQTDLLSLAVGIALGVLVGSIPIGLRGGTGFSLGMGGGPLVVALLLSYWGRVGRVLGHFPAATQLFLVRLGLALLLAGAAMKAGTGLVSAFSQHGWTLVAMVAAVTAAGLCSGVLVCTLLLRQTLLEAMAIVAGGTNATPAYEALSARADSDLVLAVFTTAYAVAMILMVVAVQVVIAILQVV